MIKKKNKPDHFDVTCVWKSGFKHTNRFIYPTRERIDSYIKHLESLDSIIKYKIIRVSDKVLLAQKGYSHDV